MSAMIVGTWFHNDDASLSAAHPEDAFKCGVTSARSYTFEHIEPVVESLKARHMSVLAGVHVNPEDVLTDPLSIVTAAEIEKYLSSGVKIDAICIGNELRDPWTEVGKWTLSPKLAANFAIVLRETKRFLSGKGIDLPLTYGMERPFPWDDALQPVVDACDWLSINLFALENRQWFGSNSLSEYSRFLTDPREQRLLLLKYELALREVLERLAGTGKKLLLSETGLPSGISYEWVGEKVVPQHDIALWVAAYERLIGIISDVTRDYKDLIAGVYLYEWRDNYVHTKRMLEDSPIHTCFGLCHTNGEPKTDIRALIGPLM